MARAIIRVSFNNYRGPAMTYARNLLESRGFQRIGTASYERRRAAVGGSGGGSGTGLIEQRIGDVQLDHIWIYVDSGGNMG